MEDLHLENKPTTQPCHPDNGGNPESHTNLTSKPNIPTLSSLQRREPCVRNQSHFKTQQPYLVIPTTEGTLHQKPISLQNPTTQPCHPDKGGNPESENNLTSKPNIPNLSSRQRREPCVRNQSHFKTQQPNLVIPTKEGTLRQYPFSYKILPTKQQKLLPPIKQNRTKGLNQNINIHKNTTVFNIIQVVLQFNQTFVNRFSIRIIDLSPAR